jgi:hypothetical protein
MLLTLAAAAGCGGSNEVTYSNGVIHIGVGVNVRGGSPLTKSVLGIRVGTTENIVEARLGEPYARPQNCWAYHADQGGSSTTYNAPSAIDAIDFCMTPSHRVGRILLGGHA